jgi:hypothetical protein
MTFGVKPVPQILPALLIERRRVPAVIPAAVVHASIPFHPVWNWNGSHVAALADEIGYHPMFLSLLQVFNA